MAFSRFSFPTPIHFGAGVRVQLPEIYKSSGCSRPLFVSDRGVATFSWYKGLMESVSVNGIQTASFSEIFGNPVKSQVTAGVKAYKDHRADSIIAVGGGAALDVAKAIALMATHPGDLFDYEDEKPGAREVTGEIPYWIAIPTTAGTGSEVGRSSVISDDQTHLKKIIFSPKLLARTVIADPELTVDLPAKMTAATGMDALTHCIEAFLAKGFHPLCDGIALEGIRLGAKSLVRAVKEPSNLEARGDMLLSSMFGAIAFQKGLGVVHSCAHALGTVMDMHHGLANGMMINYGLKMNMTVVPDRFRRMARTLELKNETPEGFMEWLIQLKKDVGMPTKMSDVGVTSQHISKLVEVAIQDGCHPSNPCPVTKEDFNRIFNEAL